MLSKQCFHPEHIGEERPLGNGINNRNQAEAFLKR